MLFSNWVYDCDWIQEKLHNWFTHLVLFIQRYIKTIGNVLYRFQIFKDDKGIVVLLFLQVTYLSVIPNRFYDRGIKLHE